MGVVDGKQGKPLPLTRLEGLEEGQGVRQVGGEGPLRCRLLDMGLIPGTKVTLQKVAPMGDPIEIRVRGYELTLRVEDGQKIQVEEVKA